MVGNAILEALPLSHLFTGLIHPSTFQRPVTMAGKKKAFRNMCVLPLFNWCVGELSSKDFFPCQSLSLFLHCCERLSSPCSCCVWHNAQAQLQKTLGPSAVYCWHWQQEGRWTVEKAWLHIMFCNCRKRCYLLPTAEKNLSASRAVIPSLSKPCSTETC